MIRFASAQDVLQLRSLWKAVFGDTDAFIDLYFSQVFRTEQCVVSVVDETVVAAMQVLPYTAKIKSKTIFGRYIFAVMCSPEYRQQGHMRAMFDFTFDYLKAEAIPFAFLIPQEAYLFDIYKKFSFQPSFKQTTPALEEAEIVDAIFTASDFQAYSYYYRYFDKKDGVLLTEAQFEFVCDSLYQEGGDLLVITSQSDIAGLALVLPKENELVVLALWADTANLESQLYSFIKNKYSNLPLRFSSKSDYLGMVKLLDDSLSYDDFESLSLALMMNE